MDDEIELEIEETGGEFGGGAIAGHDDQIMEEGEISDTGDDFRGRQPRKKSMAERLGPRPNLKSFDHHREDPIMEYRAKLPDLVRELGGSGMAIDRQSLEKMEARAKRFQLKTGPTVTFDDVLKVYDSLDIPEDQRSTDNIENRDFRLGAIHITGIDSSASSDDLFEYFKEFTPISFEWCDGKSANVIWAIDISAGKAMCSLSRPILQHSSDDAVMAAAEVGSHLDEDTRRARIIELFDTTSYHTPIDLKELGLPNPPLGGTWRIGKPSDSWSSSNPIFMRFAMKRDDSKIRERDLKFKHRELMNQGGIISSTKKHKIKQALLRDQEIAVEKEKSKKYTGPVGSNPWGAIAEDWAGTKKFHNDFADDLQILADRMKNRARPSPDLGYSPGVSLKRTARDWDAPEEGEVPDFDDEPPRRGGKRQRLLIRDRSSSPQAQTVKISELQDDENDWTRRSKVPRMKLYSDTIEQKADAKTRILKSYKRTVPNNPLMEIYEEDDDESMDDENNDMDMREKLNMKVRARRSDESFSQDARSRLNERFNKSKVHSRLGERVVEDPEDSGDSLERDTGADLGDVPSTMVIQVTQSDNEDEEKGKSEHKKSTQDEAMEQDEEEHRDIDHRKRSKAPVADLRSKISSQVVKIKAEKVEESHRRAKDRDDRRRHENTDREAAERDARRHQRSERRIDRDGHDDRRRRHEQGRRDNDTRSSRRESNRDLHDGSSSSRRVDRRAPRDVELPRQQRRDAPGPSRRGKDDRRREASPRRMRIKKEKASDDSSSSDDDSSSSSSSDSSDSSSESSSSSSSSDSSSSDTDSSHSSAASKGRKKKVLNKPRPGSSKDDTRSKKSSSSAAASSEKKASEKEGIKDKLQEYLAKAKERRKKSGK